MYFLKKLSKIWQILTDVSIVLRCFSLLMMLQSYSLQLYLENINQVTPFF